MNNQKNQWLRLYVSVLDDVQLQSMPAELFRFTINLWALVRASNTAGLAPNAAHLAFRLRLDKPTVERYLRRLTEMEPPMLEFKDDGLYVRNWETWQYESDASAARMGRYRERHRERHCDVTCDVTNTSPVTPSDTDTDKHHHPASARGSGIDPETLVENAFRQVAEVWPPSHRGDPTYALQAWKREAAMHTAGVEAWCRRIAETGVTHAAAHRACLAGGGRHFCPTLERWVRQGDYSLPAPEAVTARTNTTTNRRPTGVELVRQMLAQQEAEKCQ